MTATALTQRKGGTSCRAVEVAWQSWRICSTGVCVFLHTHAPLFRRVGGGLAVKTAAKSHSYAFAQNKIYVKLLLKSFNINDLQAISMHHNLCSLRKTQDIVCQGFIERAFS